MLCVFCLFNVFFVCMLVVMFYVVSFVVCVLFIVFLLLRMFVVAFDGCMLLCVFCSPRGTCINLTCVCHCACFVQSEFPQVCHSKKDYDEVGPSICRHNPVFGIMS